MGEKAKIKRKQKTKPTMKIRKTLQIFFAVLFLVLFAVKKTIAQTSITKDKHKKEHAEDEKYLKGFDEKAIIAELKQKGVSEKNFKEIIQGRKYKYIEAQKVKIKPVPYFPQYDPNTLRSASGCPNADFESYNFTNWSGGTGDCTGYPWPTFWFPGLVIGPPNDIESDPYSQHDILTNPAGYDMNAGLTGGVPNIPYIAPGGGSVSVRLGNSYIYQGTEFLSYPLTVTAANNSFSYQYAIVLEHPQWHAVLEQPRFTVTIYDNSGAVIPGPCMSYSIDATAAATDTSYKPFNFIGGIPQGYYKKWTTMVVDLTPYIGQTVTIEFVTQDCTLSGHFGYAYFDATCFQLQTNLPFCQSDSIGSITAPSGYSSYQWFDGLGNLISTATGPTLNIVNPVNGSTYTVVMQTTSGCSNSLTTSLVVDSNSVSFNNIVSNPICFGYNGSAYINQSGGGGPFIYTWTDSAGTVIPPIGGPESLLNVPAGQYTITVQAANGCVVSDTFLITQPPVVVTYSSTPICPDEPQATLSAPAGSNFQWYDDNDNIIPGANSSTYTVFTPTLSQTYSLIYNPPTGCPINNQNSFYLYQLNQAPFGVTNVTCFGYNDGAANTSQPTSNPAGVIAPYTYSWTYAGSSSVIGISDSINNIFAGTYYVTATSSYGCAVSDTIVVTEQANTFDSLKVTMKYCPDDDPIVLHAPLGYSSYAWYENANATGPVLSTLDSLVVSSPYLGEPFTVFMPNPIAGDCNIILKINLDYSLPPPIPGFITNINVFTPNGDGINDNFLLNEYSSGFIKEFHIQVFNRWGRKVFEADDLSGQWDGKIKGNNATDGVYYWMATYTQACLLNAPQLTAYGFVQILR